MYINMYNKPIRDMRVSSRKVFFSLFAYCSSLLFLVGPIDVPNTFPSVPPSRRRAEQPRCFPDYGAAKPRLPLYAPTFCLDEPLLPARFGSSLRSIHPKLVSSLVSVIVKINPPCVSSREPPLAWSPVFCTRNVPPPFVLEEKNRFCAFSVIVSFRFFFCFFWVFFFLW